MKQISVLVLCLICSLNTDGSNYDSTKVVLRGKVLNSKTHKPVRAKVDIFYNSDFICAHPGSTPQIEFTAPLADYGMYLISITAPGYMDATDTLWVLNQKRKIITRNFYVAPIEVGLTVTLSNIYFEFGKAELSGESVPELDKTVEFFRANPGAHFEIAGHTDRSGAAEYNLQLSQDRAEAVVHYLTSHGVDPAQLIAHGYGATKPIGTERTREAEAKNRRVEFTVLKVASQASRK